MRIRTDDLHLTTVDSTTVVLDTSSSEYLTLNPAGAILFDLLTSDVDVETLSAALIERYGISEDTAAQDVLAFVALVRERGLLVE